MTERTQCVVIGGGPAGMVAGLLLARAGVDVTVLEKHGDFLRDFLRRLAAELEARRPWSPAS